MVARGKSTHLLAAIERCGNDRADSGKSCRLPGDVDYGLDELVHLYDADLALV